MSVAISRQTRDALGRVLQFFGIDDCNLPLFSQACAAAGVDAFSKTIEALDGAISVDRRNGINGRIRQGMAVERKQKGKR